MPQPQNQEQNQEVLDCWLTRGGLRFGYEAATVGNRIVGRSAGGGPGLWEAAGVVVLPGEGGAEKGEGLAGARGGLEEGVAVSLPPGTVQSRDDPAHVCQLGAVWLVGELHRHARYLVHVLRARVRVLGDRRRRIHLLRWVFRG